METITIPRAELKTILTRLERLERIVIPSGEGEFGRDYIERRNAAVAVLNRKIEQREGKK